RPRTPPLFPYTTLFRANPPRGSLPRSVRRRRARARSCRRPSGRRSRSRPYRRLHGRECGAGARERAAVGVALPVPKLLERLDERRGGPPARVLADDAAIVLVGCLARLAPAVTGALGEGEEAPVEHAERGGRRAVLPRRPAP